MWNTCGFKLRQSLCLSLVYLQSVPAAWRLLKPPPAVCWGSGTPTSADPVAGCCTRELPPELWVTAPAPCSPAAASLLACKQTHTKANGSNKASLSSIYCIIRRQALDIWRRDVRGCLTGEENLRSLAVLNWPRGGTLSSSQMISANLSGRPSVNMKFRVTRIGYRAENRWEPSHHVKRGSANCLFNASYWYKGVVLRI